MKRCEDRRYSSVEIHPDPGEVVTLDVLLRLSKEYGTISLEVMADMRYGDGWGDSMYPCVYVCVSGVTTWPDSADG